MAEFLWTMNLFWRLTHHRFHQRVSESSSEVSQWDDVPRISHILVFSAIHRFHRVETRKNAVVSPYTRSSLSSAYLSLIFLSGAETTTSSSSSTRDEVFPRFLSWSMTVRSGLSPSLRFYARPVSHTCTRHCDIRDYLGLMEVCGRYACNRGPPVADRDRSVLSIVHDGSPRSKKLSLSLTFRATSIVYRTRLSSTIRFAFPSLDLSFLFFFFLRWFQWSRLEAFVEMAWICWRNICIYTVRCVKDKSIGCTRNRFKDKICIFTNLILFMRHKNSHYLFMCRRRIIFIYIFVTVYTSCMKYRAGGVSRLGLPS